MRRLTKAERRAMQYERENAQRAARARARQGYHCPAGRLWDVHAAPWWNAPAAQSRQAYYLTMRVHYGMNAADALATTKRNAGELGLGSERGFMVILRDAIRGAAS